MKEFKVNQYITLKLEKNRTEFYIGGQKFRLCKYLIHNTSPYNFGIEQIDAFKDRPDNLARILYSNPSLDPQDEFWGHCSQIQAWAENNYDTSLTTNNLTFPLLKRLTEVGDRKAIRVFKSELIKRFSDGNFQTVIFLLNGNYLSFLSQEQRLSVLTNLFEKYDNLLFEKLLNSKFFESISNSDKEEVLDVLLQHFKSITELIFVRKDLKNLPDSIGQLHQLEKLQLSDNQLSTIPESIGDLSSLKELYVDYNPLKCLPESIGSLKSLEKLIIINTKITILPESIGKLNSLTWLDLRENKLSTLPKSIKNLESLQTLLIGENLFVNLPEVVCDLSGLENLSISNNKLVILPESIGNLHSLKTLYLRKNRLALLPESIGELNSLRRLNLEINQLKVLPDSIGNLSMLQELNLEDNMLYTLPETILNLKKLKKIWLRDNPLNVHPDSKLTQLLKELLDRGVEIR